MGAKPGVCSAASKEPLASGVSRVPGTGAGSGTSMPPAPLWLIPGAPRVVYFPGVAPGMLRGRVFKGQGRLRLRLVMILVGFG